MRIGLPGRPGQSGSLLIITLWLVTILAVLAVATARYLSLEIRLMKYQVAREQAKILARSGIYLAMRQLQNDVQLPGEIDWLGDRWALPWDDIFVGEDRVRVVSIVDDERKLNLNAIDNTQLSEQLGRLIGPGVATQAIVDYLTPAAPTTDDAATSPAYVLKHGPVVELEELLDLAGVKEVFSRMQQVMVASIPSAPPPKVNINTVERDVLVALGGNPAVVDAFVAARPGADGKFGTIDDCSIFDLSNVTQAANDFAMCAHLDPPLPQLLTALFSMPTMNVGVTSSTFHIRTEALVGTRQVRQQIDAVVQRTGSGVSILQWRQS